MYCCAWRRNLTNGRFPTNQNVWATTEILHEILGAVFDQCTQGAGKLEPFYNMPCCLSDGRELPAGCIYLKFFQLLRNPEKPHGEKGGFSGTARKCTRRRIRSSPQRSQESNPFFVLENVPPNLWKSSLGRHGVKPGAALPLYCAALAPTWIRGDTAQRASGDFARHLLANFPSYFTKMLVNTSSIHSAFCFIWRKILRRICRTIFVRYCHRAFCSDSHDLMILF